MGVLDRIGLGRNRLAGLLNPAIDLGIASPWAEGNLTRIVPTELFGSDLVKAMPLGRSEALAIPAVSKARNLLVSTISKYPLKALDRTGELATQPTWLYRTNGPVSPYSRMAATMDDLIFYGVSLWEVERGAKQTGMKHAPILNATWTPMREWAIRDGELFIREKQVADEDYILFDVPMFDGLLSVGSRTLRGARDTELAWTSRIENPIFVTELRITEDNITQDEADEYLRAWQAKHTAGQPSIGITPLGMEMHTHGDGDDAKLFIENRNAVRTDVGSFLNVRASMLDGTAGIDSLTYSTTQGERNAFYDEDLPFWINPIEAALSMDLCVPSGQRVRFDRGESINPPTPTGAPSED